MRWKTRPSAPPTSCGRCGRRKELLATTEIRGRAQVDEALARGHGAPSSRTCWRVGGRDRSSELGRAVPTTAIVTDDWLAWAVEGLLSARGSESCTTRSPCRRRRAVRAGEAILVLGDYMKQWMRTYPLRLLDAVAELPAARGARTALRDAPVLFSVLPVRGRRGGWSWKRPSTLRPRRRDGGGEGRPTGAGPPVDRDVARTCGTLGGRVSDDMAWKSSKSNECQCRDAALDALMLRPRVAPDIHFDMGAPCVPCLAASFISLAARDSGLLLGALVE